MTFRLHRVLPEDLPRWLAIGWREVARSWIGSLFCEQVVIRWDGDREPPIPSA